MTEWKGNGQDPGPAAGVRETQASQSQREAAFWHVAKSWGLEQDFTRCELLFIDGQQYACMELIPLKYDAMEKAFEKDPAEPKKDLEPYRQRGRLHQWAVIDAVLGNGDRHAQNLLVSPEGDVKLIDHGSAFSGYGFNPSFDKNSFIPFYLRYPAAPGVGFNTLSVNEKLRYMVLAPNGVRPELRNWLNSLDPKGLESILAAYGVDSAPMLDRLAKIKTMVDTGLTVDAAINKYWAGT